MFKYNTQFLFVLFLVLCTIACQTNPPQQTNAPLENSKNIAEAVLVAEKSQNIRVPLVEGVSLTEKPRKCRKLTDCPSYEFCNEGVCRDRCAYIKCKGGHECKKAKCVPLPCKLSQECPQTYTCSNGYCIDKCSLVKCKYGCLNGDCLPKPCKQNQQCLLGQACVDSVCTERCAMTTCIVGNQCIHGDCYQIKCKKDEDCRLDSLVCVNGGCTEKCTKDSCKGVGQKCTDQGKCVSQIRTCKSQSECGIGQKCLAGKCVDSCQDVKCKKGQTCIKGQCKPGQCGNTICPPNSYCKDGVCELSLNVCTEDTDYEIKLCTEPRPTWQNCPLPSFAPPGPPPSYCGITADGQRINFLYPECTVCQSEQIIYYFNKPCYNAPFICNNNQKCERYYCSAPGCSTDSQCPYNWQVCYQGNCYDNCRFKKCASCQFGECLYKPNPKGSCAYEEGPISGGACQNPDYNCHGFYCTDDCERQPCIPSQKCQNGQCIPE